MLPVMKVPGTTSTPTSIMLQIGPARTTMSCGRWSAFVTTLVSPPLTSGCSRVRATAAPISKSATSAWRSRPICWWTSLDVTVRLNFKGTVRVYDDDNAPTTTFPKFKGKHTVFLDDSDDDDDNDKGFASPSPLLPPKRRSTTTTRARVLLRLPLLLPKRRSTRVSPTAMMTSRTTSQKKIGSK